MKRRVIVGLLLSLFMSVTSSVSALALSDNEQVLQNYSYSQVKNEAKKINLEDFRKFADEKAKLITDEKGKYGLVSVQYAMIDGDDVILSGTSGKYSKTEDKELTKDNMYGIASISKMYTTAAVMKLVDEGKVDLDLPVVNYIPDFKTADKDELYKMITPRMLINHSSGLMGTNYTNLVLNNDNDIRTGEELLEELANQRLKAKPGEFSVYCNDGFSLAELLVERVSGKDFSQFIAENFSEKLNLNGTKTLADEFDKSRLARTYENDGEVLEGSGMLGSAGLYSTAEDNCRFSHAITRRDGKGIISDKSIKAMAEKEYLKGVWPTDAVDSCTAYGLGFDNVNMYPFNKYGITALSKGGDLYKYHGSVISLPQYDINMTVLSSGGSSAVDQQFAVTVLLEYLKEKGIISEILPDEKLEETRSQYMPRELKKYEGEYYLQGMYVDAKIDENEGKLLINYKDGRNIITAYHTYSGYFVYNENGTSFALRFVDEKNGKRYIEFKQYVSFEGLAQYKAWAYIGQAVDKNENVDMSKDENLQKVWNERLMNVYFIDNEKYSSSYYNDFYKLTNWFNSDIANGYINSGKIKNDKDIENFIKIPGQEGRDLNDYSFVNENGVEHLKYGARTAISNKDIGDLKEKTSTSFSVKIDDNGCAKWFKSNPEWAGKKIKVNGPKNGTFAVYTLDAKLKGYKTINNSYVTHRDTAELGENAFIVFAADKGSEFKVDIVD